MIGSKALALHCTTLPPRGGASLDIGEKGIRRKELGGMLQIIELNVEQIFHSFRFERFSQCSSYPISSGMYKLRKIKKHQLM